jgi:hypothetical protein
MHLNEWGLWTRSEAFGDTGTIPNDEDRTEYWRLIHTPTEERLFTELEIEYVAPERRNFEFLLGRKKAGEAGRRRGRPKKVAD